MKQEEAQIPLEALVSVLSRAETKSSNGMARLIQDTAEYGMKFYTDPRPDERSASTAELIKRAIADLEYDDKAISALKSRLDDTPTDDPNRHVILFQLAFMLCRRVEADLPNASRPSGSLLRLHHDLILSVLHLREAIDLSSKCTLDVQLPYYCQLGHTATLWSSLLLVNWSSEEIIDLLKAEQNNTSSPTSEELTGIMHLVIKASILSLAYSKTDELTYRKQGRELYQTILKSMNDVLALDAIIGSVKNPSALSFITDNFIPFVVQLLGLLQHMVEIPISALVGHRLASVAITFGFIAPGVEWLEQCLMAVWSKLDLRETYKPIALVGGDAQTTDLRAKIGWILRAYLGLCVQTDMMETEVHASVASSQQVAHSLVKEWINLQKSVLADPNLGKLFRPSSFKHICAAARRSRVVMINLWGSQCDALVFPNESDHNVVHLEGVTENVVSELQSDLLTGIRGIDFRSYGGETIDNNSDFKPKGVSQVFSDLWFKIVKPIFNALGLKPLENAESDPPRITWCATGPMSFLPLHAAGNYHSRQNGTKAFEYVASSYTPTLSILAKANDNPLSSPFKGALIVSQPEGSRPIPETVEEAKAVRDKLQQIGGAMSVQWLNGTEATKDAVLKGMCSSSWVHLACHARQYPLNAIASSFILADGEQLRLSEVYENTAIGGDLAYLSACQTAAGDFDLSKEGVHLASGMLVAGYRSVIATMWSVKDSDTPVVAKTVYERLSLNGQINRDDSSLALHHAVRQLRCQVGEREFWRWAPFIHFGA
ncbi:hypothetical protein VKT23_017928 [Stygiomarasmius scandens]|uniref:CHAT domain-containing protein n=1 Tax=Marasmiellus scandens TaxID=2682957 RepID=A0ABR1IUT8_9AGAR